MEPWERHAAGAGMKRFSYAAASDHPRAGFLVTCAFRREKSATKEIMDALPEYVGNCSVSGIEVGDEEDKSSIVSLESRSIFSLIKLSGSGIVFLSTSDSMDVVSVLLRLLEDIKTNTRKPLLWCNRLTPVQATCLSEENAIHATVLKLLRDDAGGIVSKTGKENLKYAVGFNKRAGEDGNCGVERGSCIEAVARAMRDFAEYASVDLSNPEIVVAVELLPLVGMKDPLCGVSLLPKDVVNVKPRISIKPLASEEKPSTKKRRR